MQAAATIIARIMTILFGRFVIFFIRFVNSNERLRSSERFRNLVGFFSGRPDPTSGPLPLVLYLRSFREDVTSDTTLYNTRHEQLLVSVLDEVGQVVAVGRPGEASATPGAARVYVVAKDWRQGVKDLLARAEVVVIQADVSDGLLWEVTAAVRQVRPERLLISLPYQLRQTKWFRVERRRELYLLFRQKVGGVFPVPLPPSTGRATFLCFDSHWRPTLLNPPSWWKYIFGQLPLSRVGIRETIRPFCERQGFKINRRQTVLKSVAFFLGPPLLVPAAVILLFVLVGSIFRLILSAVGLLD